MRRTACITLVAALFLVSGCGLFGEEQSPFTAEELDKLLSHSDLIYVTAEEAEHSYTGMNLRERDNITLKVKNDMIQKLGWDLHRYYYIKKNIDRLVSLHFTRINIKRIEEDLRTEKSSSKRQNLTSLLEHRQKALTDLLEEIDSSMTVAERVLIDERMDDIRRFYKRHVDGFKWDRG